MDKEELSNTLMHLLPDSLFPDNGEWKKKASDRYADAIICEQQSIFHDILNEVFMDLIDKADKKWTGNIKSSPDSKCVDPTP